MLKEVITFFGADAKVGTSMIAQSVAEELAAKKKDVLLIFASQELYDEYIDTDDNHTSIDDIHLVLPDKLQPADISHITQSHNGFDYIKGTVRATELRFFHEEVINAIIHLVAKKYDYIIIDGGHNYQYPLPVYSLLAASKRVYVLTQDYRTVARFNNTLKTILKSRVFTTLANEQILINKYSKNEGIYSLDNIKEMFGLGVKTLPKAKAGATCEANRETLMKVDRAYRAAIAEFTQSLISED